MEVGYYDKVFEQSSDFNCHYKDSKHYPMWLTAVRFIKGSITELGCGTGQFAHLLSDLGYNNYKGYDYSGSGIKKCKERCNLDFIQKDFAELGEIESETVIALEVLEHIENDIELIGKIKKGARVIFSVPNFTEPSHVRIFNNKLKILERYGEFIIFEEIKEFNERELKRFICKGVKR